MEPPAIRSRGRPRKRRNDLENACDDSKSGPEWKKQAVEIVPIALLGRYVLKEFKGSGVYLGRVVFYEEGLYRLVYEDGDSEDLESREIRGLLVDHTGFDDKFNSRRKKLDELALKLSARRKRVDEVKVESSALGEVSSEQPFENSRESDVDTGSSSDSSDRNLSSETETLHIPPPYLPPSSGTIGVPGQYISHLLAVYGFLRSFSVRLFLFPFSLDDFVGSLNCRVSNTLLDSIHVALMRALHHHLETLSSDGLETASRCLRCMDWSLLDTFTWPVYLVQYLTVMGYAKGWEWNGFYGKVLDREYYSLPVDTKLMVLQILCDDVLDSAELRAEMDMREELEIGPNSESDGDDHFENGPRRVHPRYSKTSACIDGEPIKLIAENHGMKSSGKSNSLGLKGKTGNMNATNVDVSGNSDECGLCGMDGLLLCCDGCPSAYHSRCIGVMKMFIPDGPWYCPECSINKIGPTITKRMSLRGAEIFGIDSQGQIFLGSCNHLLVLKASINSEPCLRYYNKNDILKVLKVLCSSVENKYLYTNISRAIIQYWDIPESVISPPETTGKDIYLTDLEKNANLYAQLFPANEEGGRVLDIEAGKSMINVLESKKENGIDLLQSCTYLMRQPEGIKSELSMLSNSISQLADLSDVGERSRAIDLLVCTSGNNNSRYSGNGNNVCFPVSHSGHDSALDCAYMGSKPQAYINHYMHGEFAASAAAKLAALSSEEIRVSEVHSSENSRKAASANNLLQAKAFSLTASRFFWPSSERKLMEVPRERCGWCLSCKASIASKRGCMLNHAALSATKAAMKVFTSIRPLKNVEGGSRFSIVAYILYIEESLSSLVVGPFLSPSYRRQWRQQLEQASSCCAIKPLLLELEQNIRMVTFLGDWFKLVDDWFLEHSVIQNATGMIGITQKRGPGRRKQSMMSDVAFDDCHDKKFVWWRGKLSRYIFQRAALPKIVAKRAARKGGRGKISGVYYADGLEIPKRTRQFVWRAAIDMSKNASQLAVQVRYLDHHLRWTDLVRPEQSLQDTKGPETEASVFRNASICDKKTVENKISYGVAFVNQKHLPSRVMKNVLEIEQCPDGKGKYWFAESRIPLYLVKEFEESLLSSFAMEPLKPSLSKSQRNRLKSLCKDIFFYLTCRRDNLGFCPCSSCQMDVLIGNALKCSGCQGYCHEKCTVISKSVTEDVGLPITCKKCYRPRTLPKIENIAESPTSPLPLRGQEYNSMVTMSKSARPNVFTPPSASIQSPDIHSFTKQSTEANLASKIRKRSCSWGIIWKKKNNEDTGANFRQNNILLKGGSGLHGWNPVCHLCSKPYRSDLMYICCETCKNWYHAEAVELEESKIFDVVGFKCCRCRRIKSPECPYMDPKDKKPDGKKTRIRPLKPESVPISNYDLRPMPVFESKECEPTTPVFLEEEEESRQDNDPLLFSPSRVELITEHNLELDVDWNSASGPVPQKLPVRRYTKHVGEADGFSANSFSRSESSKPFETDNVPQIIEKPCSSPTDWNASSMDGFEGGGDFDYGLYYEDMEFEPQTYFSFTELLDGADVSGDVAGADWDNSVNAVTQDDIIPEQCGIGTISIGAGMCRVCSETEPAPDLSCDICGLSIHNKCSPWDDDLIIMPLEGGWSCGQCREWR